MPQTVITFTPGTNIIQSAQFKPGVIECFGQDGAQVLCDNALLDFSGVVLKGGNPHARHKAACTQLHEEFSYNSQKEENERITGLGYHGTALTLIGRSNLTIRGLTAQGFNRGIYLENCQNILIENCNFSYNFNDEDCGWTEHPPLGGIILSHSSGCIVRHNRANHVWNGISLRHSHHNEITDNDFSFCTNMCVKMWNACHNTISCNNLSWGLRIRPGEVHARDSAGLLMESGSCHNRIIGNDCTHGGDGIFIRTLNGWHSSYNLLADNDCSYANNNAIEAWANHNTYLRNKANHSSYGFWLGGSDFTTLIENEAAFNGRDFCNAPELFGNAGIAVVNGSGTNLVLVRNRVFENAGPGIALRYEESYPIHHVLLMQNEVFANKDKLDYKGCGLYVKNVANITLANNSMEGNDAGALIDAGNVTALHMLEGCQNNSLLTICWPPSVAYTGQTLHFSAEEDTSTSLQWDFGDGTSAKGWNVSKVFSTPGSYYIGATAVGNSRAAIQGRLVYILPEGCALLPPRITRPNFQDPLFSSTCCAEALRSTKGHPTSLCLMLPTPAALKGCNCLSLMLHLHKEDMTTFSLTPRDGFTITLLQDEQNYITLQSGAAEEALQNGMKNWENDLYQLWTLPLSPTAGRPAPVVTGSPRQITRLCITMPPIENGGIWADVYQAVLWNRPAQAAAVPAPPQLPFIIEEIRFKANLERTSEEDTLPQLKVSLHPMQGNAPDKKILAEATFTADELTRGDITVFHTGRLALPAGQYAVIFSQAPPAQSRTQGAYYRIPNGRLAGHEVNLAFTENVWKDDTDTWGHLWLQICGPSGTLDYTHERESYGARIGLAEAEKRCQTFTIPTLP